MRQLVPSGADGISKKRLTGFGSQVVFCGKAAGYAAAFRFIQGSEGILHHTQVRCTGERPSGESGTPEQAAAIRLAGG